MKRTIIFLALALIALMANAGMIQISGRIVSNKLPVEYANIVILTQDSTFVKGSISDQSGRFTIDKLLSGEVYKVAISSLGYGQKVIELAQVHKNTDLGEIEIKENSIALKEVKVTASNVLDRLDKKVILPTSHAIKASTNGVDLLQQLKLSRLHVDAMRNTITSSNEGEVQLRINGTKAEIQEVKALQPKQIKSIEYHDDPGLRYGKNVAVVIDYITKRPVSGGFVGVDTQNALTTGYGDNSINAKFNHKKSEWNLFYWGMYRDLGGLWRKNRETFNFADGTSYTRKEQGLPGDLGENHHYGKLSYNYQQGKLWFLNANMRFAYHGGNMNYESLLFPLNAPSNKTNMFDLSSNNSRRPSLDLYFQRNFDKRKTLILNVVGTYINSNEYRSYTETKKEQTVTNIASRVKGDKYSLISEAIYEMGLGKKDKLTFGSKYYQAYASNDYFSDANQTTTMKNGYATGYAEWAGQKGKLKYRVGVQAFYDWTRQGEYATNNFVLLPRLNFGYQFSKTTSLRFSSRLDYNGAGLSQLGDVEQKIDALQSRRGNPNLGTMHRFSNRLNLEYRKGLFAGNLNLFYQYQKNPIMEATLRENDHFIRTSLNQKGWHKFNPELELKFGPIAQIFNVNLTGGMNYFESKGVDYHHRYTNWYYTLETSAAYKKWMAFFQMQNHKNDFYGETLTMGESYHSLGIRYRLKNLNIGVMALNPFSGQNSYNRPTESFNKYAPSKNIWYIKDSARLYVVTLSWNFSFGRKYKSAHKRLNNQDTQTGTLKSGK